VDPGFTRARKDTRLYRLRLNSCRASAPPANSLNQLWPRVVDRRGSVINHAQGRGQRPRLQQHFATSQSLITHHPPSSLSRGTTAWQARLHNPVQSTINYRPSAFLLPHGRGGGVGRGRRDGRGLGVALGVAVGLTLGEGVTVGVGVAVGGGVAVGVGVTGGVPVGLAVAVAVAVAVGVGVGVTGGVAVGVPLGDGVGVGPPPGTLNL
jgi:hypothetical protein